MDLKDYLDSLPSKRKLSEVKHKIIARLWGSNNSAFPKPWVSSAELLQLTGQKYFDRRTRELRDYLGCDIETEYRQEFSGHGWRLKSAKLNEVLERDYLSSSRKKKLFEKFNYRCAICGQKSAPGVRGLQADHKIPLSRQGTNELDNWQPICNNCNVGKRRACDGCSIDCHTCSWAFPEKVGVPIILSLNDTTIRTLEILASERKTTLHHIIMGIIESYVSNST